MGGQRNGSRGVAGGGSDGGGVAAPGSGRAPEKSSPENTQWRASASRTVEQKRPPAKGRPKAWLLHSARDGMREVLTTYESNILLPHLYLILYRHQQVDNTFVIEAFRA